MINYILKNFIQICSYVVRKNIWNILMYFIFVVVSIFSSINAKAEFSDISNDLMKLVKKEEGFSSTLYEDGNGKSICFGLHDPNGSLPEKLKIDKKTCENLTEMYLRREYDHIKTRVGIYTQATNEEKLICVGRLIQESIKRHNRNEVVNVDVLLNKCLYKFVSVFDFTPKEYQVALNSYIYQYGYTFFNKYDKLNWTSLALCLNQDRTIKRTHHCSKVYHNFRETHLTRTKGVNSIQYRRKRELALMIKI